MFNTIFNFVKSISNSHSVFLIMFLYPNMEQMCKILTSNNVAGTSTVRILHRSTPNH